MEWIKFVFDKLSQYGVVVNIIPGTVLALAISELTRYDLMVSDNLFVLGVFLYFVGVVNNRFGSVVVEWVCKSSGIVEFAPYKDFLDAEKEIPKLSIMNMENNSYRSYISVFILSLLAYVGDYVITYYAISDSLVVGVLSLLLVVLFGFSYRKQTSYIRFRVEKFVREKNSREKYRVK